VATEDEVIIQWKTKFQEDEERRTLGDKEYRAKKAQQRKKKIDKLMEHVYQEEQRRMKWLRQSSDKLDQIADHAKAWR
jgi:tryptophanyl-tRNA synthetase